MNYRRCTVISAIVLALFLFFRSHRPASALPLTETIYIIPENGIELNAKEEVIQIERYYRKDRVSLGLGLFSSMSLWLEFHYLTEGAVPFQKSEVGDFFLKTKFFIGDYFLSRLHACFYLRFRIPTGKNAYASAEWRNLSLGKNEITLGPIFRFDFFNPFYVHLNVFYTFREGENEDFYGGFYLNIFKSETWTKLFGLNPWQKHTFLEKERLVNDYLSISLGINSDALYPFIPFFDCYTSFRFSRSAGSLDSIPIEAGEINPVFLLSTGVRYFFTENTYAGVYVVVNPLWQRDYTKMVYGIELSFQF